ncbi:MULTISPECIES: type II secretion system protein [unclassified Sulfurospirillum]|uniref:type II secretion system protein n=1 Tax=unclassified Sulfurospirillum TaxID=2618290 RepID=UPI0005001CD6|nr:MULTISPECIES: type II secretion system protein [unclassified Sulfurospirillum]KFL34476.1 hypothetical protein JU57_05540 [Sulfurospirillum sp. SCADC]
MRVAMSLIELVFAIVIMGIAVMSLPLILTQVQNNNAFAMQQEAILAGKKTISAILTSAWDIKSYPNSDTNVSSPYVLDVSNGDPALDRFPNTNMRIGHVKTNNRRKFYDSNTSASNITENGFNDINSFDGDITKIILEENAKTLDYVLDFDVKSNISYANDQADYSQKILNNFTFNPQVHGATTNIKTITVTVRDKSDNNKTMITFHAFRSQTGDNILLTTRPYQ